MNEVSALNHKKFQIIFLLFSTLLIFLGRQTDIGLLNFDDSFYAQKAKELFAGGSFWLNTFYGQPDFDKPPLPLWLTALAFKLFGVPGIPRYWSQGFWEQVRCISPTGYRRSCSRIPGPLLFRQSF